MAIGVVYFPIVSAGSVTDTWDPTSALVGQRGEPGTTVVAKDPLTGEFSILKVIQMDNAGVSQGEVLVTNFATLKSHSMSKASTTDGFSPARFRGIAAATIASQKCGYMYIAGYVEKADLSLTAASGDLLSISASVAGKLTPKNTSFWSGTAGVSSTLGTAPFQFAISRAALATGVGSIQIVGVWG